MPNRLARVRSGQAGQERDTEKQGTGSTEPSGKSPLESVKKRKQGARAGQSIHQSIHPFSSPADCASV